ncbi:MAG: D-tyrosyl-tRNA(Tyr) deacylase [Clostridia bacterium]|nr:D-tyrosyl-tRNA(Tyr) deacylase [Clostridia bacterium]
MRAVIIRVSRASITINGEPGGSIDKGFVVLVGVKPEDTAAEAAYLAKKCSELRVFEDENGKMNKALADVGGSMMVVSNFTLYADCSHGRRPDFFHAAKPDIAIPVYEHFISEVKARGIPLITGEFGADMAIDHVNDGPVTILMDTDQMLKRSV